MPPLITHTNLKAKLAARRSRHLVEAQRDQEQLLAEHLLDGQEKQLRQGDGSSGAATNYNEQFKMPLLEDASEETSLLKEQVFFPIQV